MENTIELYAVASNYAPCVDLVIVYDGAPIQPSCRLNISEIENLVRWRHTSGELLRAHRVFLIIDSIAHHMWPRIFYSKMRASIAVEFEMAPWE